MGTRFSNGQVESGFRVGMIDLEVDDSELREVFLQKFIRAIDEGSDTEEVDRLPLSERFTGSITGGDIVATIQEVAYRIMPHMEPKQKDFERGMLFPDLLDDDGKSVAGIIMVFESLSENFIGEPRSIVIIEDSLDSPTMHGLAFQAIRLRDPIAMQSVDIHNEEAVRRTQEHAEQATGVRVLLPGMVTSVENLIGANALLGTGLTGRYSATSNIHLLLRPGTREADEVTSILVKLDKVINEYTPPVVDE